MPLARLFRNYYRAFTFNLKYDRETERILKRVLKRDSTCVDVGSYRGKILKRMLRYAPEGKHFAFEPLPGPFRRLRKRFGTKPGVSLFNLALGDRAETRPFLSVKRYPSYSGFRRHHYPGPTAIDEITVEVASLDEVLPTTRIDFIKIDVEGAEWLVLQGARELLRRERPWVLFEFGQGGAGHYGTDPAKMYDQLTQWGFCVSLLEGFLRREAALSRDRFVRHYAERSHFYFLAYSGERFAQLANT